MKFDIILPTTGRPSLITTINSVLAQDHQDFHLWVVCDGFNSKEACWPMDHKWLLPRHMGRILGSDLKCHEDYGAWARNEGIRQGKAEWIAYIDDDDIWLPNHLSTISSLLEASPHATMIRTAGQSFYWRRKSPRTKKVVRKMGQPNTTDILTVGMAHTRELFKLTEGWRPEDNHDRTLWNEMKNVGGVAVESNTITFEFAR